MQRVRLATLADLELLVAHRRGMWVDIGGFSDGDLDAADGPFRRWARTRLRSGKLVGFVSEQGSVPVASGCVWLQPMLPRPRQPNEMPYLLSMYTMPSARGQGHAQRIVEAATAWAAERGYPKMTLHASVMGRGVYEKLGWERTWEMRKELVALTPASRQAPSATGPR